LLHDVPIVRGHANCDVMADGRLVLTRPEAAAPRLAATHGWLGAPRAESAQAAWP
jgi:hypothetical protein